ncbi:MAG: hypothetical protein JO314_08255 [Acidobacteria bacterium]|nr:hypothetical protein [Acidobacteriota bacterium]
MHTTKTEAHADPWYKNAMNKLRDDEAIREAIRKQVTAMFAEEIRKKGH